jgi:hypothetical protein
MIITKNIRDNDIPMITKETYNLLKSQFGYNARIGDIVNLIEKSFGVDLDVNFRESWNPLVFSKLLDFQKDYLEGGLDLDEFRDYLIRQFQIPSSIVKYMNKNNLEDRLWAIMMSVALPSHNYFELRND